MSPDLDQDWDPEPAATAGDLQARLHEERELYARQLEMQNEELRLTQISLVESALRGEFIFQQAPVGYLLLDARGMIHKLNDRFSKLVGVDDRYVVGRGLADFIQPSDREIFHVRYRAMFEQPKGKSMEFTLRSGVRVLMDAARPSMGMGGLDTEHMLLVTLSDITDLRRLEADRKQSERQLQTAQKMESLGALAGGVAHDMNNVMGAILGMAELHLRAVPEDSPVHQGLQSIAQACLKGRTLVQGLLRFSRSQPAEEAILDLNLLVEEEMALLDRTTLRQITLMRDLAPDLMPVKGDGAALSHVLMNLCVNAVEAMPVGGNLTIRTRNDGRGLVLLEAADTGLGMTAEVLERATDPFFTTKGHGTGMGLAMAYSTLKAHRGQLEIESTPGRGTTVRLLLPAMDLPASTPSPAAGGEQADLRPLAIVVVDDEELLRSSLCELLEMDGHSVTGLPDGEAALAHLRTGAAVDVLILDMNMPGLGGAGTLPLAKRLRPDLPVLIDTGRADQRALDLCKQYPGVALISKPFTRLELAGKLATLVPA